MQKRHTPCGFGSVQVRAYLCCDAFSPTGRRRRQKRHSSAPARWVSWSPKAVLLVWVNRYLMRATGTCWIAACSLEPGRCCPRRVLVVCRRDGLGQATGTARCGPVGAGTGSAAWGGLHDGAAWSGELGNLYCVTGIWPLWFILYVGRACSYARCFPPQGLQTSWWSKQEEPPTCHRSGVLCLSAPLDQKSGPSSGTNSGIRRWGSSMTGTNLSGSVRSSRAVLWASCWCGGVR